MHDDTEDYEMLPELISMWKEEKSEQDEEIMSIEKIEIVRSYSKASPVVFLEDSATLSIDEVDQNSKFRGKEHSGQGWASQRARGWGAGRRRWARPLPPRRQPLCLESAPSRNPGVKGQIPEKIGAFTRRAGAGKVLDGPTINDAADYEPIALWKFFWFLFFDLTLEIRKL
ncbi:hypothetical protein PAAG_07435 [Paracoccidioides lutzii Pb01]|uniref:Uncharacterized protein n=1 Tax=Paracoccidioides lutzii (strain ATCC MYA-826 / Pb01) TaxID=502779 RepID=C1H9J4_PARBA|nr:hypothetical protein PAAG_07435 [Paracoccidioides lutzii Pb01]EEH37017.2 hypothetical protein PAAG_07435 [Paracoccidioides lutzii Pb01]